MLTSASLRLEVVAFALSSVAASQERTLAPTIGDAGITAHSAISYESR